jgi:hypothetical protein
VRWAVLWILLEFAGCGDDADAGGIDAGASLDGDAASCSPELPASCPSPAPSWRGSVAGLVEAHCTPCHSPGGRAFDRPFTQYSDVYDLRGDILDQVYSCFMPPPDGGELDPALRQELIDWLVCGAPNN